MFTFFVALDRVIDELNPEANLTKQEVMSLFNETVLYYSFLLCLTLFM